MAQPALEIPRRGADLRAPGGGAHVHQRKEAVRRAAGDEAHDARLLQRREGADDIAPVRVLVAPSPFAKALEIVARQPLERGLLRVAVDVARGQILEAGEPVRETAPDQIVVQHRDQGRRERKGDPPSRAAIGASLEDAEEREIALEQRLDEPALLERILVLRMAHIRKVRMEHDRKETRRGGRRHDSPGRVAR
jgi:hypothetical protein